MLFLPIVISIWSLLLRDNFFAMLMSAFSLKLVPLQLLLFIAHSAPFVVQSLILTLGEAGSLVVHEELLCDRLFLILLSQSVDATSHTAIINNCADLEVLGQLVTVISPVEALREDLVSHLNGFQIHLELFSHFDFGHVTPGLASILLTLLLPFLLVELVTIDGFD